MVSRVGDQEQRTRVFTVNVSNPRQVVSVEKFVAVTVIEPTRLPDACCDGSLLKLGLLFVGINL